MLFDHESATLDALALSLASQSVELASHSPDGRGIVSDVPESQRVTSGAFHVHPHSTRWAAARRPFGPPFP